MRFFVFHFSITEVHKNRDFFAIINIIGLIFFLIISLIILSTFYSDKSSGFCKIFKENIREFGSGRENG